MPGGHQITTAILTGPHQIPGRLLNDCRHPYLDDLAQVQQPGQMRGITGIGVLTRSPAGRISFAGAATRHTIAAATKNRANPNPVGPAS